MNRTRVFLLAVALLFVLAFLLGDRAMGQADKKAQKKEETILDKTIAEWIKILREHENPKYRKAALIALEYGNATTRTALSSILDATENDKDAGVRRDAVLLIGRLGPDTRGATKALVAALQADKSEIVREAAATALGNKFTEQAADYVMVLVEALKDAHVGTRIAAATALRNIGENALPALPALIDTAKNLHEQPLVRTVAIHILARQGKKLSQTIPLLVEMSLNEGNPPSVREAAIDGLGRSASEDPTVFAALAKALAVKNTELRKSASVSLSTLGARAKSAWPEIKARLSPMDSNAKKPVEPESSIRNHLIRLTGILAKENAEATGVLANLAVNDESTENRIAAIQELGVLGPAAKQALPVLVDLASQDVRSAVRDAAANAVVQIKR